MKSIVKNFGQFVNESDHEESIERRSSGAGNLVATVELSRHMSGEFATIIFCGNERSVEELDSMRATWQNILDTANAMGADLIYSAEDEEIISQDDIDLLDDKPNGWNN